MMVPLNVSRSTMAAQRRGSVNVFVQPPNDSFEAIATLFFSSRSVRTWKRSSAPWPARRRSHSDCAPRERGAARPDGGHRGRPRRSELNPTKRVRSGRTSGVGDNQPRVRMVGARPDGQRPGAAAPADAQPRRARVCSQQAGLRCLRRDRSVVPAATHYTTNRPDTDAAHLRDGRRNRPPSRACCAGFWI